MKLCILVIVTILFLTTESAFGVAREPGVAPLQPLPEQVTPNYSGNIQSGSGVDDAIKGDSEYQVNQEKDSSENGVGGSNHSNYDYADTYDSQVNTLAMSVLLGSIAITLAFYAYRKKQNTNNKDF